MRRTEAHSAPQNAPLELELKMNSKRPSIAIASILGLAGVIGCGNNTPTGSLIVSIQAEDTIAGGLASGTGPEDVVDGWSVTFDKYLLAIGHLRLAPIGGGTPVEDPRVLVIDLKTVPETGRQFLTAPSVAEGRYRFEYQTPVATVDMERDASVSQADFDRMVAGACTYLITGSATNGARTVAFDFCLDAEAAFECSSMEGMEGIVISASTNTAFMTIHGDHLFFNGFPAGDEAVVLRRAGWLALVDDATGADGMVTNADLEATPLTILPPTEYALTGAPLVEGAAITNMALYARAQLSTQGHLNGEGECLSSGASHMALTRGL